MKFIFSCLTDCFKVLRESLLFIWRLFIAIFIVVFFVETIADYKISNSALDILLSSQMLEFLRRLALAVPVVLLLTWRLSHLVLKRFDIEKEGDYTISFIISLSVYFFFCLWAGLVMLTKEQLELLLFILSLPSFFLLPSFIKWLLRNHKNSKSNSAK